MLKTVAFWQDDFPRPKSLAVGELPPTTDVAIVGAGYTGLSAARALLRSGAAVTVIDAGSIGSGASSVNGGMVNIGLKAPIEKVWKAYGEDLTRRFWQAGLDSVALVEEIVESHGIECDLSRVGGAELGTSPRDLRSFRQSAEWIHTRFGHELVVVGPESIREVVDSARFTAATIDAAGAGVHPARYVYGLAGAVAEAGATLVEDAPVTNIARTVTGYQLLTPRGKVSAGAVLLATNGYTGTRPVPALRRRVIPIGSYIVVTEPLDEAVAERLIPANRMLWTARRFLNYFRRTPDNRILMGGRNDLSTDLDLMESAAILGARTTDVFPELADRRLTHSWGGKLGVTFDLMPHIGRVDGMWYALGYGGHGVAIATYLGAEVAGRITGELDSSPFEEIPHPTRPYYRSEPWFLPAAARLYRMLDAVGR
ncbi:MAG TPA: FAD-binding oxidoreductase [Acidimicrobiia bacterium]